MRDMTSYIYLTCRRDGQLWYLSAKRNFLALGKEWEKERLTAVLPEHSLWHLFYTLWMLPRKLIVAWVTFILRIPELLPGDRTYCVQLLLVFCDAFLFNMNFVSQSTRDYLKLRLSSDISAKASELCKWFLSFGVSWMLSLKCLKLKPFSLWLI